MIQQPRLLARIYRLKILLTGALLVLLGLLASLLGDWLQTRRASHLIVALVQSLSDVLVVTGGFGIAIDFVTGRDKEAADIERTRSVLKELTPDFADAVVRGFAVSPDDLKRVATPELLDGIAINVLALRLGDRQFAEEIYTDVRDQAIRALERWYDVDVSIRLSSIAERGASGDPLFDVTIEWAYTTTPTHPVQRFACVSDKAEFDELVGILPATSAWLMTPRPGFDATKKASYELLYFSVNGEERSIRRSERATGQTYTATVGDDVVRDGKPVRIKHVYRTIAAKASHRLFVELSHPVRGLTLEFDYTNTDISRMSVADLVTSSQRPRVSELPTNAVGRVLGIEVPGWLLPKAGFTFVWTLDSEEPATGRGATPTVPARVRSGRRRSAA